MNSLILFSKHNCWYQTAQPFSYDGFVRDRFPLPRSHTALKRFVSFETKVPGIFWREAMSVLEHQLKSKSLSPNWDSTTLANRPLLLKEIKCVMILAAIKVSESTSFGDAKVNCDFFVKTAIKAIKESKMHPDTKAIWQYLSNKSTSTIDKDYTCKILKDLISKHILVEVNQSVYIA